MIKLSVLYPTTEGTTFDHEYYRERHVPFRLASWNLSAAEIKKGVDGPHVASVHFLFTSMDELNSAFANEATAAVMTDVANYTTIDGGTADR